MCRCVQVKTKGQSQQVSSPEMPTSFQTGFLTGLEFTTLACLVFVLAWVPRIGLRSPCLQGKYFPDQTLTLKIDFFFLWSMRENVV